MDGKHPAFVQIPTCPHAVQIVALAATGSVWIWNNDKKKWEELGEVA